ncbi:MAG: hypothetical protein JWL70_2504 [Acidimicrobiia bacterium]|nr:hypothetical protein [Acidimicrobiia bacterium]
MAMVNAPDLEHLDDAARVIAAAATEAARELRHPRCGTEQIGQRLVSISNHGDNTFTMQWVEEDLHLSGSTRGITIDDLRRFIDGLHKS